MKKILVVGAGTMGSGISMWFAQQNISVQLFDIDQDFLQSSINRCHQLWEKLLAKGKFSSDDLEMFKCNLQPLNDLKSADSETDLVIEAIVEKLKPKVEVFNTLHEILKGHCIFATNTSGLSVQEIKKSLPLNRQKNFIGLHFFNPATIMKLVEIVTTVDQKEIASNLKTFFDKSGKVPVRCQDRPGFICNRIARNFYGEAFRYAETFNKEIFLSIDHIMREVGGFRMGPFELMDLIGIDINLAATTNVWEGFECDPRFAPHVIQQEMVKSGKLGNKNGEGFLNKEKLEVSPFTDMAYRTQVITCLSEKINDSTELVIELSTSSIEKKVNFYKVLQSKKVKVISDLSTYSKESFELLLKHLDGSIAYKFQNNNKVEVLLKKDDEKILSAIHQSLDITPVAHIHPHGHIFPRIISMIFNEAKIAEDEKLASSDDLDLAMRFGLNYPQGPLAWLKSFELNDLKKVLRNLPSYNKLESASRYCLAEVFNEGK